MSANTETHPPSRRSTTVFTTLMAIAVAGIALFIIRWASPIIGPILLGFFLAALGRPAFVWLEKRGWKRGWALGGVMLILVALGGILLLLAWLYVQRLTNGLAENRADLLSRFGFAGALLGEVSSEGSTQASIGNGLSTVLVTIVAALAGVIGQAVFGFVLAIMLLLEWPRFGSIVRGVGSTQPFLAKLPAVANTVVAFVIVRAKVNLISTVVITIAYLLLGVGNPVFWGAVNFFLGFIPYVGIAIATAGPALLLLAESGWGAFWIVIAAVTVLNLSVEYVIAPTMTGKSLNISPTVVFISFFFWSWLLGAVGMLVSMPITVLLMLVFASDPSTAFLAHLFGGGAEQEPLPDNSAAMLPPSMDT